MKLHIQVVEVVIEIALERMARVKISEGRTQPIGAVNHGSVSILYFLLFVRRESVVYRKSRRNSHHKCK
jgi:hypothetical protein